jgi:hypothetical protein
MSRPVVRAGRLMLILGFAMGCASSSADRSGGEVTIHHTQNEFRVGTLRQEAWFTSDEFRRDMAAIEDRWQENGVPPQVVAVYKAKLKITYRMRYAMEKDVREGKSSYYCIGVQLKPGIGLRIERGAFTVNLQEPSTQRRISVPDEGALIWYWEGRDQGYYDTAGGSCRIHLGLQKSEKNKYVEIYIRLPASCQGWEFVGLTLDDERILVVDE